MDVFLVYALLLVFFLGLLPTIWLVLKEKDSETPKTPAYSDKKQATDSKITTGKTASYGLLGVILVFIFVVTVLIRREQG